MVGSHTVNGVSALHSELLVKTIFADFASLYPERFVNVTNGVTPRRWLAQANPGWRRCSTARSAPAGGATSSSFAACRATPAASAGGVRHRQARQQAALARIERDLGVALDPASLFDVQVKRIHEYKRQLLNLLHVVTRYQAIPPTRRPTGCRAA